GGDGTVGTDFPDQSLCDHALEAGADQVGFDAHVDQAGDGAGGVVGVEGAQHQVAGEGGAHGDVGGFAVADFADQDDVGVVAEDGAEDVGERQSDFGVDLQLA